MFVVKKVKNQLRNGEQSKIILSKIVPDYFVPHLNNIFAADYQCSICVIYY